MRPCLASGCGELTEERRCPEHAAAEHAREDALRGTSRARGYDAAWDRLSARARRLQPFCSDCGTSERLTADHKPSAWERKAAGLSLRLMDVDVVCSDCNVRRGSSRPGTARATRGVDPTETPYEPGRKDVSPTLTGPEGSEEAPEVSEKPLVYPVRDNRAGRSWAGVHWGSPNHARNYGGRR